MNSITRQLLKLVSDWKDKYTGAYNIRENGECAGRQSTREIKIESKPDLPGLDIHIMAGTVNQTVSIPACVTKGGVDDLVYNDFYVGEGAQVTIVAGCGVHTEDEEPASHNGIHRFFLEKNSKVTYLEKHVGTGAGQGMRSIDPETEIYLARGAVMEMETSQIGGVDRSTRNTRAEMEADSRLVISERLLTEENQEVVSDYVVEIQGENAGVNLISRAVARGRSHQVYHSRIVGNAPCTGHSECDAIIAGCGRVDAAPELTANHSDAALIHEAAIGKIAGEQIMKLRTLGLTEKEAEEEIIKGFLS